MAGEAGLRSRVLVRRWLSFAAALVCSATLSALAPAPRETAPDGPAHSGAASSKAASPHAVPGPPVAAPQHAPPAAGRPGESPAPAVTVPHGPLHAAQPHVRPAPAPRARVDCHVHRCVALTFDDGPVPGTARLLDFLRDAGVRATFFVLGAQVAAHPGLVHREFSEGHEIGNHSYTHADLHRMSGAGAGAEMGRTQEAIRRVTGREPVLFRPPYGATDARVAAVARRNHLAQIMWAVDPLDWQDRDPGIVERRVVESTTRGAIILLHDIHATTVSAVPGIIEALSRRGYVFVTVSELYDGKRLAPGRKYSRRR